MMGKQSYLHWDSPHIYFPLAHFDHVSQQNIECIKEIIEYSVSNNHLKLQWNFQKI